MAPNSAVSILDRIEECPTGRIPFSVEFFPVRTDEACDRLWESVKTYEKWGACFASITYGAGGTNRDRMLSITTKIKKESSLLPLAHLTAVNHSREELITIIDSFAEAGIHNVLALRGDPPGDPLGIWRKHAEGVEFASELVKMIAERGDFHIGVAAFPNGHFRAPTIDADTHYTLHKYAAGADFSITQIFFETDAYLRLRDRLIAADKDLGSKPLIPSIMPITSLKSAQRMVELSGARLPRWLERALDNAAGNGTEEDSLAVRELGIELALKMCETLIKEGVPSLHFDTLNKIQPVGQILEELGLVETSTTAL